MAFWNRQKQDYEAASAYLRSADSVSRPMAILLSLLGFLIILSVVAGAFFGGKWVYGRLWGDDNESTVAIVDNSQDQSESSSQNNDSTPSTTSTSQDDPISVSSDSTTDTDSQQQADTAQGQNADNTVVDQNSTSTDTSISEITDTGAMPVLGMIAAAGLGYGGSVAYRRRR